MLKKETKIRVRYGETDRMGYAYHGVYAQYYEVGRVEAIREMGISYKEMEERGILLPVVDLHVQYKKPALYDDELTLITTIKERPGIRMIFHYECYNQDQQLLNTGTVTLVFVDKEKNKPCQPPEWFTKNLEKFF